MQAHVNHGLFYLIRWHSTLPSTLLRMMANC
jgi:hypothetical protein